MAAPSPVLRLLILGVAVLNLLVAAIATVSLNHSRNTHESSARAATESITLEVERDIAAIFDNIDLGLKNLVDDYAELRRGARFSEERWNDQLTKQRGHLPILDGLRASDRTGRVRFGLAAGEASGVDISDREYFRTLRDQPDAGLVISRPVQGRLSGKWLILLARRVNELDGSFAGIVTATIPLEQFQSLFATIKLGPRASIALRDGQLRLIARHPKLAGPGDVGATVISTDFAEALHASRDLGAYKVGSTSIDGIRRIHAYRRHAGYDFYVNIGLAEDDYLTPWRDEALQTTLLLALFALMTGVLSWLLHHIWTRQQHDAARLRRSEEDLRNLVEAAPYGVVLLDPDATLAYANPAFTRMLGYTLADLPDVATWWTRAYPDPAYRQTVIDAWQQTVLAQTTPTQVERSFRVCRRDGVARDIRFVVVPMDDGRMTMTFDDITDRLRAEAALKTERDRSQLYLDTVRSVVVALDVNGNITMLNAFGCALLGVGADELIGRNWFATCLPQPDGIERGQPYFQRLMSGEEANPEYFEYRLVTATGKQFLMAWHNALLRDENDRIVGSLSSGEDITERRAAEDEVRSLAFFDPLTGLPNRRLLVDRLQHSMAASTRNHKYRAVLFLDLDQFKTLNDTRGHDVGDRLLVDTASRLNSCVREGDTVSRLGGDEFVVLLEQLSGEIEEAAAQAGSIAEKITERLGEPYLLGNDSYRGTVSIGITVFIGHEASVDEVLKRADLAMYQAKAAGRNTRCFFDPRMQASIAARAALESDLRRALGERELLLHYQPQVDAAGACVGVEALLRWRNPQHGLVPPNRFIPLAEETGLILPIGNWVLREACARLAEWRQNPLAAELTVAVNVSARQINQAAFVDDVRAALAATGADPKRLKLEITESILVANIDEIIARMSALREIGVSFSLDDFGTGYSSLSYVKRLPLDQLKIDQSFVRDITIDQNDAAICRAIIALGNSLGLGIIAEGVETAEQWQFLNGEACRHAQGYLFARPMPADELLSWLAAAANSR